MKHSYRKNSLKEEPIPAWEDPIYDEPPRTLMYNLFDSSIGKKG